MRYSGEGIPLAAELEGINDAGGGTAPEDRVIKLKIEADLKDTQGDIVGIVQRGFSEIAIGSGGNVYEY